MSSTIVYSRECYALCAPDGPGTPFAWPVIFWVDLAHIITMVLGLVLIVWTPRLVMNAKASGQQARLTAQALFAMIVIGTEVDHIGDQAHYRLALSLISILLMLWGAWRLKFEVPPVTRPEHRTRE